MGVTGLEPPAAASSGNVKQARDLRQSDESDAKSRAAESAATVRESGAADAPADKPASDSTNRAGGAPAVGAPAGGFADAVAAVLRLPLTDAEKAEAVRRLLAVTGAV